MNPKILIKNAGRHFRQKRSAGLRAIIEKIHAEKGSVSIIDLGGREDYWSLFPIDYLRSRNVRILLVNLPSDDIDTTVKNPDIFQCAFGDACALDYEDRSFDLCHSNSVIEHVGEWRRKRAFAHSATRLAPRFYHQTPNYWFPIEPHFGVPFFHWLPEPIRLWAVRRYAFNWFKRAQNMDEAQELIIHNALLSRDCFQDLFPQAALQCEKFLGMNKSFMVLQD